jgi:hypothetical protein
MNMLQPMIEKKLSEILGSPVRFDRMKFSILGGSVEAEGMTVAGKPLMEKLVMEKPVTGNLVTGSTAAGNIVSGILPTRPLLKIGHLFAEMSITKALSGHLAIKKVRITDGEIIYSGRNDYELQVSGLSADINCDKNRTEFSFQAKSISRADSTASLGIVRGNGFAETSDLKAIPKSPFEINLTGDPDLQGKIKLPGLADPNGKLEISGSMNFILLAAFLPFEIGR